MTFSRRDLCLLVAALAAPAGLAGQDTRLTSKAYPYNELPVQKNGKNEFRPILSGELHNGAYLEVHQTRLGPGEMPHPPHHHVHEEMFLVRDGTLEATISGKSTRLGPGSVAFVASNDEHGIRNPGPAAAEYFVVALGKDT
ncbi:MAG: cupin domain-containing protein [Terriglobia bacterium]